MDRDFQQEKIDDLRNTIDALVAALEVVNADAGSLGLKDETWNAIDAALALARKGGWGMDYKWPAQEASAFHATRWQKLAKTRDGSYVSTVYIPLDDGVYETAVNRGGDWEVVNAYSNVGSALAGHRGEVSARGGETLLSRWFGMEIKQ